MITLKQTSGGLWWPTLAMSNEHDGFIKQQQQQSHSLTSALTLKAVKLELYSTATLTTLHSTLLL